MKIFINTYLLLAMVNGFAQLSIQSCRPPHTQNGVLTGYTSVRQLIAPAGTLSMNTYLPVGNPNILDFRNDGINGIIEYGHNYDPATDDGQPVKGGGIILPAKPILKINSTCGAHTEIGFGGGVVSTGNYFEVGKPVRDYKVSSNIYSTGQRVGQRVTTKHIATEMLGPQYNTQLFVNRNFSRALSVFNTVNNVIGEEVFTIFGDGKTEIGKLKIKTG